MAEEEMELEEQEEAPASKGGGKGGGLKTILLAAGIAALVGTNGFLLYRVLSVAPASQASAAPAEEGEEPAADEPAPPPEDLLQKGGVFALDPFLVNLADTDARRFLRTKVHLVFATKEEAEALKKNELAKTKLQDVVLEHLATKTAAEIGDEEGRRKLREELLATCREALNGRKVVDVLLTDFIIQY